MYLSANIQPGALFLEICWQTRENNRFSQLWAGTFFAIENTKKVKMIRVAFAVAVCTAVTQRVLAQTRVETDGKIHYAGDVVSSADCLCVRNILSPSHRLRKKGNALDHPVCSRYDVNARPVYAVHAHPCCL